MENIPATTNTLQALSRDVAEVVEQVSPCVVAVNARRFLSSSAVCWREGVIVTAAHTLRRTEDISVMLANRQTVAATFAGADPSTDLAVLRVTGANLSPPCFGDSAELRVGHVVIAVGRGAQRGLNATLGIVGVLSGQWRSRGGLVEQFIGLDLALHPAAAGGPLMDAHGRVLGINTLGLSGSMALTIPASTVNRVVPYLLEKGHLGRGYLGLGMYSIPLPEDLKSALNVAGDSGLIVVSVEPDGPGSKAGVLLGDVIVALDDKAVSNVHELQACLEPDLIGRTVSISMIRSGKPVMVKAIVGERIRRTA